MAFCFDCFPKVPQMEKIWISKRCLPSTLLKKTLLSFSSGQFYIYYLSYFCFVIAACEHMALWEQLLLHSGSLLHVLTSLDWKIPDLIAFSAQFSLYSCLILQLLRVNCLHCRTLQGLKTSETACGGAQGHAWKDTQCSLGMMVHLTDFSLMYKEWASTSQHETHGWAQAQSREDWTSLQLCCHWDPPGSE